MLATKIVLQLNSVMGRGLTQINTDKITNEDFYKNILTNFGKGLQRCRFRDVIEDLEIPS